MIDKFRSRQHRRPWDANIWRTIYRRQSPDSFVIGQGTRYVPKSANTIKDSLPATSSMKQYPCSGDHCTKNLGKIHSICKLHQCMPISYAPAGVSLVHDCWFAGPKTDFHFGSCVTESPVSYRSIGPCGGPQREPDCSGHSS